MIFKYLIPFDRFVISSRERPTEALQALRLEVEPRKRFRFPRRGAKAFEGEISGSSFRIRRIIGYNNGFLPVVTGTVEPAPEGSHIHIHMRLSLYTIVFCAVWLLGVVLIGGSLLLAAAMEQTLMSPGALAPIAMVLFFVLLINGGFWIEAAMQKKMLADVFRGIWLS